MTQTRIVLGVVVIHNRLPNSYFVFICVKLTWLSNVFTVKTWFHKLFKSV